MILCTVRLIHHKVEGETFEPRRRRTYRGITALCFASSCFPSVASLDSTLLYPLEMAMKERGNSYLQNLVLLLWVCLWALDLLSKW